jgi:hypothetical protein
MMLKRPHQHPAYLLRLWPVHSQEQTIWRASLENAHTGEVLGFATLAQLTAFLEAQTTALVEGQTTPMRNLPGRSETAGSLEAR